MWSTRPVGKSGVVGKGLMAMSVKRRHQVPECRRRPGAVVHQRARPTLSSPSSPRCTPRPRLPMTTPSSPPRRLPSKTAPSRAPKDASLKLADIVPTVPEKAGCQRNRAAGDPGSPVQRQGSSASAERCGCRSQRAVEVIRYTTLAGD